MKYKFLVNWQEGIDSRGRKVLICHEYVIVQIQHHKSFGGALYYVYHNNTKIAEVRKLEHGKYAAMEYAAILANRIQVVSSGGDGKVKDRVMRVRRKYALIHHPDRQGDLESMKLVNQIFDDIEKVC